MDLADSGCADAADLSEEPDCANGLDNDGDGAVDALDPGCSGPLDGDEHAASLAYDNGLDDDGDSLADFPADPGCESIVAPSEQLASLLCDNGLDDDNDNGGTIDWDGGSLGGTADSFCSAPTSPREKPLPPAPCGLGPELTLVMAGLFDLRQRRRARHGTD